MDQSLESVCKYGNCKIENKDEYNIKKFTNSIYTNYKYDFLMILIVCYYLNINFGMIITVLYILLYLLNEHENIYLKNNIDKINKEIISDPLKEKQYNNCRSSTMSNPYANYLIGEEPNLPACTDKRNEENKDKFNMFNVYENSNNITIGYSNKAIRDFYTLPVTTSTNDVTTFAKWLYTNDKLNCKNDGNCLKYDDIRYHTR
jgi:hypothetical protein